MIHHMSFREPRRVAQVIAELTQATAVQAPTPPFPRDAWLVVAGDERGSFLEILSATAVFDPDPPLSIRQRPATSEPMSAHALISTAVSGETIHAAAAREGWRAEDVETGLFRIVELWIDDNILIEFLAQGEAGPYVAAFGVVGLASPDSTLRALEAKLAVALAQKFPAEALSDALGPNWRKEPL
jgi:hypothetical protein